MSFDLYLYSLLFVIYAKDEKNFISIFICTYGPSINSTEYGYK